MNKQERKEWLLELWDYHNGILRTEEVEEVDRKLASDVEARVDSDRVREIIGELRQAGRWETHPTFPEEMVDRIMQSEVSGKGKWVAVALVLLAIFYFLFLRGGDAPEEVRMISEQSSGLALLAPGRSDGEGGMELDYSALEEGVEADIDSSTRLVIRSATKGTDD